MRAVGRPPESIEARKHGVVRDLDEGDEREATQARKTPQIRIVSDADGIRADETLQTVERRERSATIDQDGTQTGESVESFEVLQQRVVRNVEGEVQPRGRAQTPSGHEPIILHDAHPA